MLTTAVGGLVSKLLGIGVCESMVTGKGVDSDTRYADRYISCTCREMYSGGVTEQGVTGDRLML